MKKQQGFTLIELIVVIVILGILAATALPKFIDLSTDAKIAGVKGVVGGLTSAGSLNYAVRSLNPASGVATAGQTCTAVAALILEGGIPSGYNVVGNIPNCAVNYGGSFAASGVVPSI